MTEPTPYSTALSPREQVKIKAILLKAGHPEDLVAGAIERGEWGKLPLLPGDVKRLTCVSCGAKPYLTPEGRIMLGCPGTCRQGHFADLKDDALQARAERLRQAGKVEPEERDTPFRPRVRPPVGGDLWDE